MTSTVRPTKKQRELLTYIEQFIGEHGYSPSYREIMAGLNYTSVATVALHINNLIKRGHLRKRDHSARSLEVTTPSEQLPKAVNSSPIKPGEEKWLVEKIEYLVEETENAEDLTPESIDQLQVLVSALRILGLEGAAQGFAPRIAQLRERIPQ